MNGTTLQSLISDPKHARLIADVLADYAELRYPRRKAYAVLRSLSPTELWDLYKVAIDDGNESFRLAFGPVYHEKRGDGNGPLFQEAL